MSLGSELKRLRQEAGLSQNALAEALGYSCGQFVSNWERDVAHPPKRALGELADLLKVSRRHLVDLIYAERAKQLDDWRRQALKRGA